MANEIGGIRVRGKKVRNSQMFIAIDVAAIHARRGVHGARGATGGPDEIDARRRRATTK